ncbi:hypothetical protein D3C78_1940750 [compost metagenome]
MAKWPELPAPAVPAVRRPGSFFALSMYCPSVLMGSDLPTTSTVGLVATVQMGRNERTASNFTWLL